MNPVALAHFFEIIYYGIFNYVLAAGSEDGGLLDIVSTYFGIIKIDSQEMLYLHYLIWLCGTFHIF